LTYNKDDMMSQELTSGKQFQVVCHDNIKRKPVQDVYGMPATEREGPIA
jgi:hypothetical protein